MNLQHFLFLTEEHYIQDFRLPTEDLTDIWSCLNLKTNKWCYVVSRETSQVEPIDMNHLVLILGNNSIGVKYTELVVLDKEVDIKQYDCQRASEKSERPIIDGVAQLSELEQTTIKELIEELNNPIFISDFLNKFGRIIDRHIDTAIVNYSNEQIIHDVNEWRKKGIVYVRLIGEDFVNTLRDEFVLDNKSIMPIRSFYLMEYDKNQPDFQKSEQIIIDEKFCDNEHRLGNCNGDRNCSLCQDTIIVHNPKDNPPKDQTVWELKMHKGLVTGGVFKKYIVTRVPGGWLYHPHKEEMSAVTSTFVPWESQKFNTGCVLCGNTKDKTAQTILDVLNHLDENQAYEDGDLLQYIKDYLK